MTTPPPALRDRIARGIGIAFVIGGFLNKFSGHEWAVFRSTDLYSQTPSSPNYRAWTGSACFVILYAKTWKDGDLLENIPGIQVPDVEVGDVLIEQIRRGDHEDARINALKEKLTAQKLPFNARQLTTGWLSVSVQVNDTKLSWWDYSTSLHPGVTIRAYENWDALSHTMDPKLYARLRTADSQYLESVVYWILVSIPAVLLLLDVRPFFSNLTAREALFRPFTSPSALLFKRYLADVFFEWIALGGANQFYQMPGCNQFILLAVSLLDAWVLQRRRHILALAISCTLKIAAIIGVTSYVYRYEAIGTYRYITMHLIINMQWTMGNLVAQILSAKYYHDGNNNYHDTLEAAFHKLVVSMHMYTAACTKLGEAGIHWVDDRYIAQLALRGHFSTGPYPLSGMLLYMPALFRASGMAVVLSMELTAVFSWWNYGSFLCIWLFFMMVSTLTIGVPLAPQAFGPLGGILTYISQWGVLVVVVFCFLLVYLRDKNKKDNNNKGNNKEWFDPLKGPLHRHVVNWIKAAGHVD